MPWKCPHCGLENYEAVDACAAMCGHVRPIRLVLTAKATGRELRFNVDSDVGRTGLQHAGGDEAKFASQPQFKVYRDTAQARWLLVHCRTATNPTCLNAAPLDYNPQPLSDGDIISIGPLRLQLHVRLEKFE
jgi:hypothetical protein